MYLTLDEKLKRLKSGDPISTDLIIDNFKGRDKIIYLPTDPYSSAEIYEPDYIESCTFSHIDGSRNTYVAATLTQSGKTYLCHLVKDDFYNLLKLKKSYEETHFHLLKPGSLAYHAQQESCFVDSVDEIFRLGYENMSSEHVPRQEGEIVCILEKHNVGGFKLVKILHQNKVYWSYAAFFDANYCKEHPNDNHYI